MQRFTLFSLLIFSSAVFGQIPLGIGEWRTHVPHRNATSVTDAGDRVYVSTNVFFFSFHKSNREIQRFDKITGLSDVGVNLVRFNPFNQTLLVAYENTNIDLIQNNTIINISDIRRKLMVGEKRINHVYFEGNFAYLSMSFGVVILDMSKREISDTWYIGLNGDDVRVNAFTADEDRFYAATQEGLKTANRNAPNLANFNEWSLEAGLPVSQAFHAVHFNEKIYVNVRDTLFEFDGSNWNYFYAQQQWKIENVIADDNNMIITESSETASYNGRIGYLNTNLTCCNYYNNPLIRLPLDAAFDEQGTLWAADFLEGLLEIKNNSFNPIFPNGPGSERVQNLAAHKGNVWVAPGGVDPTWNHLFNRDGFFSFSQNWWGSFNEYSGINKLVDLLSIFEVAVHPSGNPVYFGSFWGGLLEINNGAYQLYDTTNSSLQKAVGDPSRIKVTGLAFDRDENLWAANFNTIQSISVRKKDGTWKSFQPIPIIDGGLVSQIIVDDFNQKWFIIPKGNSRGVMVFNHGATIENTNDGDKYIQLRAGGNGNLHTSEVLCLVNDLDGQIWLGTAEGISVFYCPGAIFDGCQAQRIIVTQDGVAGYLLEGESVNAIAVDGANRKWVGTNSGVFVLSPDGSTEIAYYNVDNSPLLSNNITAIAMDDMTGEVFIGTEKGIISYRGEAVRGEEIHSNVLVFPNPVRQDYEGPIAIKGLANDATVKITDVRGNLFYETTSFGGQAVWDGRNYHGERAKTGVYLVFSSNRDGSSTHVTKLLIIN